MCMHTYNDEIGGTDAQHQKGHRKLTKIQYKKCFKGEPYQTYIHWGPINWNVIFLKIEVFHSISHPVKNKCSFNHENTTVSAAILCDINKTGIIIKQMLLFYVPFVQTEAHSPLQSKEPKHSQTKLSHTPSQ